MKPDVVAVTPFYQPVMEELEGAYTVHRLFEAADRKAFLAGVKDKAQALATFGGTINAELMDALPKLKIVACMSVGVDNVDLAAAKARGIRVTNAPDVLTDDVADIAISLLLGVARRIPQADRYVREGKWAAKGAMPLATKLGGSTMGVLGMGRIGMAVAKRAEALGVKIVYHGPRQKPGVAYRYYADLVAMAKDVDYLMISCPGGAATRNLVNDKVIAALGKKGAHHQHRARLGGRRAGAGQGAGRRQSPRRRARRVRRRAARARGPAEARQRGSAAAYRQRHPCHAPRHGPAHARQSGGVFSPESRC